MESRIPIHNTATKCLWSDYNRFLDSDYDAQPHILYVYFFGGQECVGHSFAYVAHITHILRMDTAIS